MSQGIDFKEVRRRAGRSFFQDGLAELTVGIILASWAGIVFVDAILDDVIADAFLDDAVSSLCWFIPIWIVWIGLVGARRKYIVPRIGHVQIVPHELVMGVVAIVVVGLAVTALLGVVVFLAPQDVVRPILRPILGALFSNLPIIVGTFLAGSFAIMAFRYGIRRFYWFGLLSLASGIVFSIIDFGPWASVAAKWASYLATMAVVLLPWGLVLLIRFLRDNPVLEEEALDGTS